MEEEIWETVVEAPYYKVSNLGNVRRFIKGHKMNLKFTNENLKQQMHNGYSIVKMHQNGKLITRSVHRLVARAFVYNDDPTNKIEVNHIDLNKQNNHAGNLEWLTPKENTHHAIRGGHHRKNYRPVIVRSTNGDILGNYISANHAARALDVSESIIRNRCIKETKNNYKEFIFEYGIV